MAKRGGARPGAGRPSREPGQKRRALSTTVSEITWLRLRAISARTGQSLSQVLDALIGLAATHPEVAAVLQKRKLASEAGTLWAPDAEVGLAAPLPPALPAPSTFTVLVVEDDPHAEELLRMRLEHLGCAVVSCTRIEEAIALAKGIVPGMVILDLQLQEDATAGFAVIERLRQEPTTALIPIVIHSIYVRYLTDLPNPELAIEALLPKPFKLEQLHGLVANLRNATPDGTTVRII